MTVKKRKQDRSDETAGKTAEEMKPSAVEEPSGKTGGNGTGEGSTVDLSNLEEARKEAADNYDKYVRLAADFDNYKKRTQKDRADLLNYGNETIIKDVLPIVDSLERAIDHSANAGDFETFVTGLNLILDQLRNTLEKHGVKSIEAVGEDFDPNYHEAMLLVEGDEENDNKVIEEFEKGYLLNGRLLRPSKVSVAKTQR
ncbi:MAG TPA: nucleotide exchange factor GrpE [Deltaproteobacteria bacterium]|nr:nucleotide exchange factor GrpE [Deltaproteobacteria bacterium]